MKFFDHILTTTDLSKESYAAVQYAAHLADRPGAKLTIIHVPVTIALTYAEFVLPADIANFDGQIEALAEEQLRTWVNRHIDDADSVNIVIRPGAPAEVVCDYASREDVDLIVMGTHGRTGIRRAVLGSVTEKVIRNAPCPVLSVHCPELSQTADRPAEGESA